jgi:predicted porin
MIVGGMGGLWLFGADFIYLKANYKHFIASKNQKTLFTAKDNYYIATGANYNFNKKLSSKISYFFRYNDFVDTFIANTKRQDKNHTITLSTEYKLNQNLKAVLSYKYNSNISNYSLASYHKQVSELFIQYDY